MQFQKYFKRKKKDPLEQLWDYSINKPQKKLQNISKKY